jgi:hypothetical protein
MKTSFTFEYSDLHLSLSAFFHQLAAAGELVDARRGRTDWGIL